MSAAMALVWVATGAVLLALALTTPRRTATRSRAAIAAGLSLGVFLVACGALLLPIHVTSTIIDSPDSATTVDCEGAWDSLTGVTYVLTDAGPEFDPAHGTCEAAAWRRVALVGSVEVALAALLIASAAMRRRRSRP